MNIYHKIRQFFIITNIIITKIIKYYGMFLYNRTQRNVALTIRMVSNIKQGESKQI
jgi:hypothetical protein